MRLALLAVIVSALLLGCSGASWFSGAKAKAEDEAVDSRKPPEPRDRRTRARLHSELASLYLQSGNLAIALDELNLAISIDPDYAKAYGARGLAHYEIRELDLAEGDFQRALRLDDKDPEIQNNFGWFLCQTGREREGISYFQRAMRNALYQTPERAHLNAAACHFKLGELDAAERLAQQVLRLAPENEEARLRLATISYRRGHTELAREHLLQLLRKGEASPEVLWLAVRIERRLGNRQEEARHTSQLRRKFPLAPETEELLKGNFE